MHQFVINIGNNGNGQEVEGNLVDLIAYEAPSFPLNLRLIVIIRLITETILIILNGNDVGRILIVFYEGV